MINEVPAAGELLASWNRATPSAVLVASGASLVLVATAASVLDEDAATTTAAALVDKDELGKLPLAVLEAPAAISTLSIIKTSPSMLVILTSTVVVPVPLLMSKKL